MVLPGAMGGRQELYGIKDHFCILIMMFITCSYACVKIRRTIHRSGGESILLYDNIKNKNV